MNHGVTISWYTLVTCYYTSHNPVNAQSSIVTYPIDVHKATILHEYNKCNGIS